MNRRGKRVIDIHLETVVFKVLVRNIGAREIGKSHVD